MLDYFPCSSPAFSSFPDHAQKYPFTHAPQQQPHYSPAPSTFTFDPFADDDADDASESSQSHVARRSERVEFLRQREWMRRVSAWVEGVQGGHSHAPAATPSYGMVRSAPAPSSPRSRLASHPHPHPPPVHYAHPSAQSAQNFVPFPPSQTSYTPGPRHRRDTQPQNTHTPYTLYSTPTTPALSYPSTPSTPSPEPFEEPEPYVIYSTPLPGGTSTSPAPVKAAPSQAKKQPTPPAVPPRHVHSRVPSLDSIREEDEDRF